MLISIFLLRIVKLNLLLLDGEIPLRCPWFLAGVRPRLKGTSAFNQSTRWLVTAVVVGLVLTSAAGLTSIVGLTSTSAQAAAPEPPLTVVATIFPLADVVHQLGGDWVAVTTLLPPGASPHTFEPRPGDVRAMADASLFVTVGGGLDEWASRIARAADRLVETIAVADLVELAGGGLAYDEAEADDHDHAHGSIDPHVWLDPIIVRDVIAPRLAQSLMERLPHAAHEIEANLVDYQGQLTELDAWVREKLEAIADKNFIGYHSAWRYYARAYGLTQVAVVTPFPGQEPSARWMTNLIGIARRHGVTVVFAEPQLNPKAADTIAREIKGRVLILDPIGGQRVEGRQTYIDLIRYNTDILATGLGG